MMTVGPTSTFPSVNVEFDLTEPWEREENTGYKGERLAVIGGQARFLLARNGGLDMMLDLRAVAYKADGSVGKAERNLAYMPVRERWAMLPEHVQREIKVAAADGLLTLLGEVLPVHPRSPRLDAALADLARL